MIIVTIFPIIFLGAFSGNEGKHAIDFWRNFGLVMIPSSCVSMLQTLTLKYNSLRTRVQWFSITIVSLAIGWVLEFALGPLIGRLIFSTTISNDLIIAAFDGFITGIPIGAPVGLVAGLTHALFQRSAARQWIVGNLISWSVGIGVAFALIFAAFSQLRLM